jgi:hypothetical protein
MGENNLIIVSNNSVSILKLCMVIKTNRQIKIQKRQITPKRVPEHRYFYSFELTLLCPQPEHFYEELCKRVD